MGLLHSIMGLLFSKSAPSSEQLGFKEDFDPPLEDGLKCCVCHHGLRNPKQTHCGHRFCEGCINQSLRNRARKCPVSGCEHSLGYSEPYPDNHAKREILTSIVYCRLKRTHGCPWKGPLHDLEYHLKTTCLLTSVKCDCGCEIPRGDLHRHVLGGCPRTEKWRLTAIVNEHNAEDEVTPLQFPVREMGSSSSSEQITGIRSPVEHPQRKELQNAVNECKQLDSPVKPKDPLPYQREYVKGHGFDPPPKPKDLPANEKECGNEANCLGPTPEPKEQQAFQKEKDEPKDVPMMCQKEDTNGLDPPAAIEESNKAIALNPPAEHKGVPLSDQKEESNEVNGLDPPVEMEESNKAIALNPPAEHKGVPLIDQKEESNEVNGLDPPAEMEESNKSIALHPPAEHKGAPLIDQKEESNEVNELTPPAEMEESNKAIALDLPAGSKVVPLCQKEDGNEVSGLDHPAEPKESLVHQIEEGNEATVLDMPAERKVPPSSKPTEPSPCQMKDANGLDGSSQNRVPSFI